MTVMLPTLLLAASLTTSAPPNVILIMTDDQGYGDLGVTGNPARSGWPPAPSWASDGKGRSKKWVDREESTMAWGTAISPVSAAPPHAVKRTSVASGFITPS